MHLITITSEQEYKLFGRKQQRFKLNVCRTLIDTDILITSNKTYDDMTLIRWNIKYEEVLKHDEMYDDFWSRFELDLKAASEKLPPKALALLQKSTSFWINVSQQYGRKSAPINGQGMCYHVDEEWLNSNGMSPKKCGGIELFQ